MSSEFEEEDKIIRGLPTSFKIFLALEEKARGEKSNGTCLLSNKTHCEHHTHKGGDHN